MNLGESWSYVVATGVIHAVYLIAVALAYQNGNMSTRGTGVAGTAVLYVPLLGARLSPSELTGVATVVLGIFVVGLQASWGIVCVCGWSESLYE